MQVIPRGRKCDPCCSDWKMKINELWEKYQEVVKGVRAGGQTAYPDGDGIANLDNAVASAVSQQITIRLEDYVSEDDLTDVLDNYQTKLVSGVSIKTINNQSLLGSGNIEIQGGGGGSVDWDDIQDKPTFATVATTGNYNDLMGKPTIPDAQIQSDWTQADNTKVDYIKNKPTLATVATSGDYDDLIDKPDFTWFLKNRASENSAADQVGNISIMGKGSRENSVVIGNSNITGYRCIAIGTSLSASWQYGIVIGDGSSIRGSSAGNNSIAIGHYAFSENQNNCQLGNGVNTVANSLKFLSYPIIENGKVPANTIAPTTGASAGQVLGLDSNLDTAWITPSGSTIKTVNTPTPSDLVTLLSSLSVYDEILEINMTLNSPIDDQIISSSGYVDMLVTDGVRINGLIEYRPDSGTSTFTHDVASIKATSSTMTITYKGTTYDILTAIMVIRHY